MSRTVIVLCAALAIGGVMSSGCSDDEDASFEPRGEVESSDAGTSTGGETVVEVDTGRWSDEPMVPTLVKYLEARQASMRERRIVPDMVGTATFQWVQQQRAVIADAEQRGWTVPAQAEMRIVGVRTGVSDTTVQLCMWGPSVDFIDRRSGEPVRPGERQWYPFDVKMVQAEDRWFVSAAAEGEFVCEVGEG
jgi:hypothetical protein